jgi:peptide deformylase
MTIRPILKLPDPRLKVVSEPVAAINDAVRALIDDMFETMYDAPGIGLAAIQIGVPQRIVVMDLARKLEDEKTPLVLINPEIIDRSEESRVYEEGCLSIPDYYEEVTRPDHIRLRYLSLSGEMIETRADGLMATCIQHEIDHLNGVLFIDHLSKLKRDRVVKRFTKLAKRENES